MQNLPPLPSSTAKYRLIEVFMPWAEDEPELWPLPTDRAWLIYYKPDGKFVDEIFLNEKKARVEADKRNNPQGYPDEFISDPHD